MYPFVHASPYNFRARAFDDDDAIGAIVLTGKLICTVKCQVAFNGICVMYPCLSHLYDINWYNSSLNALQNLRRLN